MIFIITINNILLFSEQPSHKYRHGGGGGGGGGGYMYITGTGLGIVDYSSVSPSILETGWTTN